MPLADEMCLVDGLGAMVRTKYGLQFRFSIGKIIFIKRQEEQINIILEQKRKLYLNPVAMQVTGKEIIDAVNIAQFIARTNGLKHTVHSRTFRTYLDTLDFKKNICKDSNGDLFYNGTAYIKDDMYGQGHRVKIKHAPMESVIFKMDINNAVGYESNSNLQLEIIERIEEHYYDVELMYCYVEKKAEEEPPKKK
eukprot:116266_1